MIDHWWAEMPTGERCKQFLAKVKSQGHSSISASDMSAGLQKVFQIQAGTADKYVQHMVDTSMIQAGKHGWEIL